MSNLGELNIKIYCQIWTFWVGEAKVCHSLILSLSVQITIAIMLTDFCWHLYFLLALFMAAAAIMALLFEDLACFPNLMSILCFPVRDEPPLPPPPELSGWGDPVKSNLIELHAWSAKVTSSGHGKSVTLTNYFHKEIGQFRLEKTVTVRGLSL